MANFRILHLISERPPFISGYARVVKKLSEELEKIGCEVEVLSALECGVKFIGDMRFYHSLEKICSAIENNTYDIVNVHGHTPTFSDRLIIKARRLKRRVVYTFHCPLDGYGLFDAIYNFSFNRFILKFTDAVIATSKSYFDSLPKFARKYLIPWGVDCEMFSGRRVPHSIYTIVFVGQIRPYKGLHVLFEAVKGMDAVVRVVGDGPFRPAYEKYAMRLGLDNVQFYGAVSDDELREILLSSDVLVLPSVNRREAFGLVTLEAAAAGCAVVASDLPGVRDIVKDFGILVKPKNVESLRDALELLRDKKVRDRYVLRGFNIVKRYNWRDVASKYVKVYGEVLGEHLEF